MYQDSIHPPDLILLNGDSPDKSSGVPAFDSPLSTPPDSPRRAVASDDKEEEKKEEEQDEAKALAKNDDVPLGESFDKDEVVDDSESTPDDEKLPTGDEVMTPRRPNQTTTSKTDKQHLEVVHLKPVVVNNKKVVVEDDNSNASDEPPSLSFVEKAKKKLTSKGLSFTESDSEAAVSPSSKTGSPSKIEIKKDQVEPSADKANVGNSLSPGIDEPPSLSRVEQAMQRTSMMVKKQNERGRKITPTQPTETTSTSPATAMANAELAAKNSESKLAALQRDLNSLKSSLSEMNMQLKEDKAEAPKADVYNDIPLTKKKEGTIMDPDITTETAESSVSQEKPNDALQDTKTYREMTPKKDLQGSEKSAAWLEQELRRRAGVKHEINAAIESRGQPDLDKDELIGNQKSVVDQLPSISSPPDMQNSYSTMDEEVAAITANNDQTISASNGGIDEKISRKLDYGDLDEQPHDETMDELMGTSNASRGFQPVSDYQDIQHEMKKFASQTREALREHSFTDVVEDPSPKIAPGAFGSPIAVDRSMDDHTDFQMNAVANENANSGESISINFAAMEAGQVPKMLISMDSFDGIASGDIFLSLLSENTGRAETSAAATWADRVHGAIWRARRMRKRLMALSHPPAPRMMGGSQTVESVQKAALMHLKRNEIDDAINLVEGIVFAYYSYFERSLSLRESTGSGAVDFKPYIGMALHNLGILNLLKGDYDEALSYFTRAVENRKSNLGENHPHYIVSSKRWSDILSDCCVSLIFKSLTPPFAVFPSQIGCLSVCAQPVRGGPCRA